MSNSLDAGQNLLWRQRGLLILGLAGCAALGAAIWYLKAEPPAALEVSVERLPRPVAIQPAESPPEFAPVETAAPQSAAAPAPDESPASLGLLERQFHAARSTDERVELASEIAGRNDAEAVGVLERLFRTEPHPDVKVALLAGLGDIDRGAAPELRLRLLTGALHGQPRDVRIVALDSLAQLDAPQVAALLKQAMENDSDREVRDVASALHAARVQTDR